MAPSQPRRAAAVAAAATLALLVFATRARGSASVPPAAACTSCRAPVHSWDTVPVSFHSSSKATGPAGVFSAEDLAVIARFPLVTVEKWQGSQARRQDGTPVFLWEEDAWVATARAIKQINRNISVIAWMDTLLVYTGWNVDAANQTVNTTLNPDALKECATGHFRPAEYLEQPGPSGGQALLLRNRTGGLALSSYGHCHVYDHRQAAARQYWTSMCLAMTASGHVDGCGADFSAMGTNRWADHTAANIAADLGLDNATAAAWAAGHRQMMHDTQAALGAGLLVGKDGAELGDHVHAVLVEDGCYKRNATVNSLRALAARARAAGPAARSWVYQCHGEDSSTDTIAAFLAGAADGHFLTVGGWSDGAASHWSDDFSRPLGRPTGDAVYNGTTWHRGFSSGTRVTFTPHINAHGRDMGGVGTIVWGSGEAPSPAA